MNIKQLFLAGCILMGSITFAQDGTKQTLTQTADILQSSSSDNQTSTTGTQAPQNGTKQEPVKQEPVKKDDKPATASPAPAPSATTAPATEEKEGSKPGSTEKMAITESGIKKKKTKSATSTSTAPSPTTPEEKKK